jgi:hypothetical protein
LRWTGWKDPHIILYKTQDKLTQGAFAATLETLFEGAGGAMSANAPPRFFRLFPVTNRQEFSP